MIWLAVIALLIAVVTAWYLARPLARGTEPDDRAHRLQLEQLRDRLLVQLDELDIEEGDRNIDSAVASDERVRLEAELARVLRELEPPGEARKHRPRQESRRAWATALAVFGILLPLSAAGLYTVSQRPVLALLSGPHASEGSVPPMVLEMVARLEQRLAEQPDDAEGWHRLGRAYAVLGRVEAANAAYARAYRLNPDDPRLVAEYAVFLYELDPKNTGGQVFGLFSHLHRLEPENREALWFLGFAAYQKNDHRQALGYWERLLKGLPAGSEEGEHLRQIVENTRAQLKRK